jgi:cell division protein FtsB
MRETFTSKCVCVFGRKVKQLVRSDGFKAVFGQAEGGVGLEGQTTNQFDPEQVWEYVCAVVHRTKRKLATAGVGVLVLWLGFHVIFGANGMVVYQGKRSEYKKLQTDLQQLENENQQLTKDVDQLRNDPKAIEREAREQLHYTKKGEMIYLLPNQKKPDTPPADASAKLNK